MFNSILSEEISTLSVPNVMICFATAIVLGLVIAYIHMKTSKKYNKNFIITLAILPILVQVVMMMVDGNLGTSVAVLGAFSLIRFRSIPGNSREITSIFFVMAIGLSLGMGQVWFAIFITLIISILLLVFYKTKFGEKNEGTRVLKIVIPEDLDYEEVFDDIFGKYTSSCNLEQIKTTNMGSMYELRYELILRNKIDSKSFIDDLRVRNGNMKIVLNHPIDDQML